MYVYVNYPKALLMSLIFSNMAALIFYIWEIISLFHLLEKTGRKWNFLNCLFILTFNRGNAK